MTLTLELTATHPADLPLILPLPADAGCADAAPPAEVAQAIAEGLAQFVPGLDEASIAWARRVLQAAPLKPKRLDWFHFPQEGIPPVALYGLPPVNQWTRRKLRLALRHCISQLNSRELPAAALCLGPQPPLDMDAAEFIEQLGVEAALATYSYREFQRPDPEEPEPVALQRLVLVHPQAEALQGAVQAAQAIGEGLRLARDLGNRPANVLTPEAIAQEARRLEELGLLVNIFDEHRLQRMDEFAGSAAGLLLATGSASAHPPRLVVAEYKGGAPDQPPLALVGKGITFDTGGVNVKPWKGMRDMYLDMMGAAAVLGALKAIALLQLPLNVVGVCACAENAIGPSAMRPSDILTALDGSTVEVGHTDAEGRLVLGDALAYVHKHQPALVLDAATLTGSAVAALGTGRGALFSKDDALAESLFRLGERIGEPVWRLPMTEEYDNIAKSDRAQVCNVGKMDPYGDAIAGAFFLHHFVGELRWAHLDIAPIDHFNKEDGLDPESASGAGTRLFIAAARAMAAGEL